MLSHQQQIALDKRTGIMLCRTKNAAGAPIWLYLEATKADIVRLFAAYDRREHIDFSDYGRILAQGDGVDPPSRIAE
ncbi:MAG: hypothetical protein K2Q01_11615 [Rickettsiales bacterium]|nr:hypothetical protein [Rickettsiales bacterium]